MPILSICFLTHNIVKPWPQTLSPKTKTKGPWADTKIPRQKSKSKKGSEWSPPTCPAKKISGGQQEEGQGVVHHVQ